MLDRRSPLADVVDDTGIGCSVDGISVDTGDVPIPSVCASQSLCCLDGLDHSGHVEVAGEKLGVDDGVREGVRGVQDNRSTCVERQVRHKLEGSKEEHTRSRRDDNIDDRKV